ncbi:viral A-type inclusion protein [Reticulomyxa filosa]|uniref:Viral A-type inclusion protein n=1 Tax=Reticulomyxa filosa TaxID=46433 RepID=X6PG32_RETFI|nr:viral A-type inclusion protein [Reticulomyxa filosa]|eukprot:ETO36984.1 viral A-type inclusion protein [Reticulomyxa filosa]
MDDFTDEEKDISGNADYNDYKVQEDALPVQSDIERAPLSKKKKQINIYTHCAYIKQKEAGGGGEGGEYFDRLENENEKLREKLSELQWSLTDEIKANASLDAQNRPSVALAEKWKLETEAMKKLIIQKNSYNSKSDNPNDDSIENNSDNNDNNQQMENHNNPISEDSEFNVARLAPPANNSELIKHVKKQSLSAIRLFQQEVGNLRSLLGDEANQVPNTQIPNLFDDENLSNGNQHHSSFPFSFEKSGPVANNKNKATEELLSYEEAMTNDLLTIEHATAQAELEIDKWKIEAQKWKGLLDNSEEKHNQEMEKLAIQLRKEFNENFEHHLQQQIDQKLPLLQKELKDAKVLLNNTILQAQSLKQQKNCYHSTIKHCLGNIQVFICFTCLISQQIVPLCLFS